MNTNFVAPLRWNAEYAQAVVIVFPHSGAGAGASVYSPLARALPHYYAVFGVTLPGRERRIGEACLEDAVQLTAAIVHEIGRLPNLPVRLFGHSLGALLAATVAARSNARIDQLVISGSSPLGTRAYDVDVDDDDALVALLSDAAGTPDELLAEPGVQELIFPPLRADLRLGADLVATMPTAIPVNTTVVTAHDDPLLRDGTAGLWDSFIHARCMHRVIDGGHFGVLEPRNLHVVIDALTAVSSTRR